jgi:hypothetical protein
MRKAWCLLVPFPIMNGTGILSGLVSFQMLATLWTLLPYHLHVAFYRSLVWVIYNHNPAIQAAVTASHALHTTFLVGGTGFEIHNSLIFHP